MHAQLAHVHVDLTFWINKAKANKAGKVPISLRITVHGKRAEVSTGIRCLPDEWDLATKRLVTVEWKEAKQQYVRSRRLSTATQQLNTVLDDLEASTRLLGSDLRKAATKEKPFTAAALRAALVPPPPKPIPCALELLEKATLTYTNLFTRQTALTALNAMRRYLSPATTLLLPALTPEVVADFGAWPGCSPRYLQSLRSLYNRGRLPGDNPFGGAERFAQSATSKPRYVLTKEQIAALAALPLPAGGREAIARDIYLTQYYLHGSRVGVILELNWALVDFEAGRVRYKAEKGGDWHKVSIHPKLAAILRPYWPGEGATGQVFPILPADFAERGPAERHRLRKSANTKVWHGLQVIAKLLGLPGQLHSHTARHSLATHTVEKTGDYRLAQNFLGHRSQAMTERYVRPMLSTELDAGADDVYND